MFVYFASTTSSFTVTLPTEMYDTGDWYCALTEIWFSKQRFKTPLMIQTDLCRASPYDGSLLNILRVVTESGTLPYPYFLPVSQDRIKSFKIDIKPVRGGGNLVLPLPVRGVIQLLKHGDLQKLHPGC